MGCARAGSGDRAVWLRSRLVELERAGLVDAQCSRFRCLFSTRPTGGGERPVTLMRRRGVLGWAVVPGRGREVKSNTCSITGRLG